MTEPEETETVVPQKRFSRADLAKFAREGEAIYVQNTLKTIAVLAVPVEGVTEPVEFGPIGDPLGEDVQELPSVYLKNAQFRRQLNLGTYKIVGADDDEVLEAAAAQQRAYQMREDAKGGNDQFITAQQPRAFSGQQCLAQEGKFQCSEYAIFGQNNRDVPPLCSKHAHLRAQFAPEETGEFKDGKPVVNWIRVSLLGR